MMHFVCSFLYIKIMMILREYCKSDVMFLHYQSIYLNLNENRVR